LIDRKSYAAPALRSALHPTLIARAAADAQATPT